MRKYFCIICMVLIFTNLIIAQELKTSGVKLTFEEALQTAVENSYSVQLSQAALLQASASLKNAKSSTDFIVGADVKYNKKHTPYGDDPYYGGMGLKDIETDQFNTSLWVQKVFSFGLQSKISVGISRDLNSYKGQISLEESYKSTYGDKHNNHGNIELALSLPIFRSFKASLEGNNIKAASKYYSQLQYELTDSICKTMISASSAYWEYLKTHSTMLQLEEMQRSLEARNNSMDRLIKAGVLSKNDLLSMQVNVIKNERSVVAAKTAYNQARLMLIQELGRDIPLLTEPDYSFPEIDFTKNSLPKIESIDSNFIESICEIRPDIIALQMQLDAAESRLRIARAGMLPDASVNFAIGSTGAMYGDSFGDYMTSIVKNVPGANISGGLFFSMSFPNNNGKSNLENAQASYMQAKISLSQAKDTLYLQIVNTLSELHAYRNQVQKANDALALQKQLYLNEQRRFESGLITIDDMATQDSRYLEAQNEYYSVMTSYLQNVIKYKYYTGTLAEVIDSEENSLNKEKLYCIE